MTNTLEVKAVSKSFRSGSGQKRTILDGLELSVGGGESVAIVGPSGSGKTTLLNLLGALDYPDSGDVLLHGESVFSKNEKQLAEFRNRSIGFVFQMHYLLPQLTLQRLGNTGWVITAGERIFRKELATDLETGDIQTSPLLFSSGMAILDGGQARANQLQVWGVDASFNEFAGTDELYALNDNEAVINEQVANVLGLKVGEELLLRVNKLNAFPANTPFVSADESTVSFRVKVKAIASQKQTGNFNLQNIQSAPKNIFISLDWMNRQMELDAKANVILVHAIGVGLQTLTNRLSEYLQTTDLNLEVRENTGLNYSEVISSRVFIEPEVAEKLLHMNRSYPVLSYFVNQFRLKDKTTPYSFVAGLPPEKTRIAENDIILNRWLSDDLQASINDSIQINYFEVGPLRRLNEKSAWLRVAKIVEMDSLWADLNLMPEIPGLSDAGHCSDWETGVPVDLSVIRPKDENYWNDFKGTPKAFVNLQTAQKLWGNRFGAATAIRVEGLHKADLERQVLTTLTPDDSGFQVKNVWDEGFQAAGQGVDFGELFLGLSFFVLFAALLLAYLMFQLYLNFRQSEIGTLHALGFDSSRIRKLFFAEAAFLTLTGVLTGIPLGIAYNHLILDAINTIWRDIVRTSILHVNITPAAIIQAVAIVGLISLTSVWFILRKYAGMQVVRIQRDPIESVEKRLISDFKPFIFKIFHSYKHPVNICCYYFSKPV